jgi:hypothetical protein
LTRNPAAAAIDELLLVVDWLAGNLLPGTHRPYIPRQLSAEKQAELARKARETDFLEYRTYHAVVDIGTGVQIPLGESPAPMNLEIAELLADIAAAASSMCQLVTLAGGAKHLGLEPLLPAQHAHTDPRPYLQRVRDVLPWSLTVWDTVESTCHALTRRGHVLLGLFGDGQMLKALCPWCDGRTPAHPSGGQQTLRVCAEVPKGQTVATVHPNDLRWLVICESALCEPPSEDFGEWYRGRPAWSLRAEGDWLAARLEMNLDAAVS